MNVQGQNMKSVSRDFGFWLLMLLSLGTTYNGEPTVGVIALVGAVIFDAIHALKCTLEVPKD